MNRYAIVLAAGKGTRMKSRHDEPKVAFPILGKPMLSYVNDALAPLGFSKIVTVVGFGAEKVKEILGPDAETVFQEDQKGTGHAVLMAAPLLEKEQGVTLICSGDTPLITDKTISAFLSSHQTNHNAMTLLTAVVDNPYGHGRIVKENGRLIKLAPQKDCTPEEDSIHEINTGVYAVDNELLFECLKEAKPVNASIEFHLTDLISLLLEKGKKVGTFTIADASQAISVNDRYQLSTATKAMRERIARKWMDQGVTIEDPDSTYIGPDVTIGRDTIICPNCYLYGKTAIGADNIIGPETYLEGVIIGEGNKIAFCHLTDTEVGNHTDLGPYLRTRKGVIIHDHAHIGNFNELKNVEFGEGSKCAHLSYLGDADIGDGVNIGCGTIIANYDGVNKTHTSVGEHAFIGSGSILISPVNVGDNAFVAAGSTINKDVEPHAMAIARERQTNKPGYSDVILQKAREKKENKE